MQTLPQLEQHAGEARPVSEILAKANPAEMPAMRASLSFLTSAGAELATVLERRNREYDNLMNIVSALPPEWIEAAKTGALLPDVGSLRAEIELAKNARIDLHGQIVERDQQIKDLQDQIGLLQTELLTLPETRARQMEELQAEMDGVALARAEAEDHLKTSEAELNDIESRLANLRDELTAALPEDAQAEIATATAEEPVSDPRQRRAMRLGALAAATAALIDSNRQTEEQLQIANTRIGSVLEEFEIVSSGQLALEADLQEKLHALEDQQTQIDSLQSHQESLSLQIEQLTEQVTLLQAELDNTLAAKAQAEEQLQLREGELAELNQQIDSVAQQLTSVLPEDVIAQITPVESEEPSAEDGAEGAEGEAVAEDDMATRSVAPKMLGLGALAAGVAAALDVSKAKAGEAEQANAQLSAVIDEKSGLENAVGEKEQALADLNARLEALNAQTADAQEQLAAALALKADLEQQLSERTGHVGDLEGQIQDAVARLQEIVPAEDLPLPEVPEIVEGEASEAGEGAGDGAEVKAVGLAALVTGVTALVSRNTGALSELDAQIGARQAEIEGLSQEKASLVATLEEKEHELVDYNNYALNLQGQVNELAAKVFGVEAALALKEEAEAEAQAQVESLTAQVDALTAQVAELEAQLAAANSAKAELEQTLQATQAQLDAAQAELAQIDEASQQALGEKALRIGAVGAGAAAIAAIRDKEEELAAANEQVRALQGQVDELAPAQEQVAALQGQVDELAATNEQLLVLQGQVNELAAVKTDLETQLGQRGAELESWQEQVAGITGERDALQVQLDELRQKLDELDTQLSTATPYQKAAELSEALSKLPAFKTDAATAALIAGAQPVLSSRVQALTDAKGIGSVYQQRLYNAGVGTYWELANVSNDFLQSTLEIPELQMGRMNLDETRLDAFQWAQLSETVGLLWDGDHVDDFEALPGIGKTFEKRLYEAGITTYEQLADCARERLAEIIQAPAMSDLNLDDVLAEVARLLAARQSDTAAQSETAQSGGDQPTEG